MAHMTRLTGELMFNEVSDQHGFGGFSPELLKATYDWMVQAGQVKALRDPETFVDRSFLPKR
jgi:hypothetical protein